MHTLHIYWIKDTKPTAQQVKTYLKGIGINVASVRKRTLKHWSKNTCWKIETTDTLEGFDGLRNRLVKSVWLCDGDDIVDDVAFTSTTGDTLSNVFKHDTQIK